LISSRQQGNKELYDFPVNTIPARGCCTASLQINKHDTLPPSHCCCQFGSVQFSGLSARGSTKKHNGTGQGFSLYRLFFGYSDSSTAMTVTMDPQRTMECPAPSSKKEKKTYLMSSCSRVRSEVVGSSRLRVNKL